MNALQQVIVGQEAAVRSPRYDRVTFGYQVTKVTPSGQIVVRRGDETPRRFQPSGWEIGVTSWNRCQLVLDVAAARDDAHTRQAKLVAVATICNIQVNPLVTERWSLEQLQTELDGLQQLLDAAKRALAAVTAPITTGESI